MPASLSRAAGGVSVEYTVKVTPPQPVLQQPAAMAFTATYRGASAPLRLTIGLPSWQLGLDLLQELHFTTPAADAGTVLAKVPDAGSIAPELQSFVATAIQNKILLGLPDGRFDPTGTVTRAQTAVVLDRVQTGPLMQSTH